MDRSYVYEEDENEEGLTFKAVGHFLAKGWLRMAVYMLIAVALVSVVVLPVKYFYKSEQVAQTSIEYIYEGIEEGLDPNGGVLNTDNIISTTVLSNAVRSADLGNVVTDISKLRAAMRVEAVQTDEYVRLAQAAANGDAAAANELRNYVARPTQYTIIISAPKKLGLNDTQAKVLLDKVISEYGKEFQKRFSVANMFSAESYDLSDNGLLEFVDIYDLYMQNLEPIETYLNQLLSEAPTFTSTQNSTTFATLVSDYAVISRKYDVFNNYVLSNNVWRSSDTAKISLVSSQKKKSNELAAEQAAATATKAIIEAIKPNTITTTIGAETVTTESYPEEYYAWLEKLDAQNGKIKSLTKQLSDIELRLERIADADAVATDAELATAMSLIKELERDTVKFVEKVNATVTDYFDTTFVSSSMRSVREPIVTRRSSGLNVLIIYACAVLVGLLAGGVVTGIKIYKANSAAKLAAAQTEAESAESADGEKPTEVKKSKK